MSSEDAEKDPVLEEKINLNRQSLSDYPGFDSPASRHQCDESLRRFIARAAADFLQQVASVDLLLAQREENDLRGPLAAATRRIEGIVDKIQSVPYSFSPFYQVDWLPTDTQYRIANDDQRLIEAVHELMRFLEPTLREDADFAAIGREANNLTEALDERLESRVGTIMEFQG